MMQDLAMYLLDIGNNSIKAKAKEITIVLTDSAKADELSLSITDDGCGMDEDTCKKVVSPFYTTRTTRKIGLGVAFFKELAEQCEGRFTLTSTVGKGTFIEATAKRSHYDTPPYGDIAESIVTLIQADENIDWLFQYKTDDKEFIFDTKEIRAVLEGVSLTEPSILLWMKDALTKGITEKEEMNGGTK